VTPYEAGFLDTQLDALFVINRMIDVIFLKARRAAAARVAAAALSLTARARTWCRT
jgi:hypothetical protein